MGPGSLRRAAMIVALALANAPPTFADPADPAAARIAAFDQTLVAAMRLKSGRDKALAPTIATSFNLSAMAEFIVGAAWAKFSATDRQAVTAALADYTVARFAHDFTPEEGRTFSVDARVQSRGVDKRVRTKIVNPGETPDLVDYRLRAYKGEWKIIDVYANGVSELATQRAEIASTLASGDVAGLVARIGQATRMLR